MTFAVVRPGSQIASLLAQENIRIRQKIGVTTAHFDLASRELVLPYWKGISQELYDLLLIHETGHALYTPGEDWFEAIVNNSDKLIRKYSNTFKDYVNVIEDTRVDRFQKNRYPGSKRDYDIGYDELWEMDFFKTKFADFNKFPFIDRINLYFKGGFKRGVSFSDSEKDIVKHIESLQTFDEVLEMSKDIFHKNYNQHRNVKDLVQGLFDKLDEILDDQDGDSIPPMPLPSKQEQTEEEKLSNLENIRTEEVFHKEAKPESNPDIDEEIGVYVPPMSITYHAWEDSIQVVEPSNHYTPVYRPIECRPIDEVAIGWKDFYSSEKMNAFWSKKTEQDRKHIDNIINEFKLGENRSISYMVKEFQLRKAAFERSKEVIRKTGTLDTNLIYNYKYTDDIFKKNLIQPTGKNHGFVMFLDWSGSMTNKLIDTYRQLMGIMLFCQRVNIPFEVYIFAGGGGGFSPDQTFTFSSTLQIYNIFSSQMSATEFNQSMKMFMGVVLSRGSGVVTMNSTPLNATLYYAPELINRFRKKNNVQVCNMIVLTDGDDGGSYAGCGNPFDIVEDDAMHCQYTVSEYQKTKTMLDRIKALTKSNVLGFFLADVSAGYLGKNGIFDISENQKSEYRKNGFTALNNNGYDEFYIIDARTSNQSDDEMDFGDSSTKTTKINKFIKYVNSRAFNRVILSKFIDRIVVDMRS